MRCNDCNKSVSFDDDSEPEVTDEIAEDDTIVVSVRHVRCCDECSAELQEYEYAFDREIDNDIYESHSGEDHELFVESEFAIYPVLRKRKTFFKIAGTAILRCECQDDVIGRYELEEEVSSSDYEEV